MTLDGKNSGKQDFQLCVVMSLFQEVYIHFVLQYRIGTQCQICAEIIIRYYQTCSLLSLNLHNEAFIHDNVMDRQCYGKKCLLRLRSNATVEIVRFVGNLWSVCKKVFPSCVNCESEFWIFSSINIGWLLFWSGDKLQAGGSLICVFSLFKTGDCNQYFVSHGGIGKPWRVKHVRG